MTDPLDMYQEHSRETTADLWRKFFSPTDLLVYSPRQSTVPNQADSLLAEAARVTETQLEEVSRKIDAAEKKLCQLRETEESLRQKVAAIKRILHL